MSVDPQAASLVTPERFVHKLGIAWRHPTRGLIAPVGVLRFDGDLFWFHYVRGAVGLPDFRPLPGFPALHEVYRAPYLFPFFAHRVMDPRRPEYAEYLEALDLGPDSTQLAILARSGGRRVGDKLQLAAEPVIERDGATTSSFLVHGIRFVPPEADAALAHLRPGDQLRLVRDDENPVNPDALYVTAPDETPLGWVPELLVDYVNVILRSSSCDIRVLRINSRTLPSHLRLLVKVTGRVTPGYQVFAGGPWESIEDRLDSAY